MNFLNVSPSSLFRCGCRRGALGLLCGLLLGLHGSAAVQAGSLEERAAREAERAQAAVEADRAARLNAGTARHEASAQRGTPPEGDYQRVLSTIPDTQALRLADALQIGVALSREFASQRDSNLRSGLSYLSARHLFEPRLSGSLALLANWSKNTGSDTLASSTSASAGLGVDYRSEFGTQVRVDAELDYLRDLERQTDAFRSSVGLSVTQPLLRGAGRTVNREPLTQAERSMIYRLRDFELFRQRFSIALTSAYYNLLREKEVIDNNRQRFEQSDFLYRRAQALSRIGRVPELDVLQAEQTRLQAENNLRDAEESHKDSLLRFKTFLGLPDHVPVGVSSSDVPVFRSLAMDVEPAVELALQNRLDYATVLDSLEDAQRGLKIARNGLLPDLGLTAGARTGGGSERFAGQVFDDHNLSAGLNLSIPFDRLNEKIAVKNSELSLDASERSVQEARDSISADVRSRLRDLARIEKSMVVQKKIVEASTRRLTNADMLFRQGKRTSRDVVEAQQDLLSARNANIQFSVDHAIAALNLRRELGLLVVLPDGRPLETPIPGATLGEPVKNVPVPDYKPDSGDAADPANPAKLPSPAKPAPAAPPAGPGADPAPAVPVPAVVPAPAQ